MITATEAMCKSDNVSELYKEHISELEKIEKKIIESCKTGEYQISYEFDNELNYRNRKRIVFELESLGYKVEQSCVYFNLIHIYWDMNWD